VQGFVWIFESSNTVPERKQEAGADQQPRAKRETIKAQFDR